MPPAAEFCERRLQQLLGFAMPNDTMPHTEHWVSGIIFLIAEVPHENEN
jgi:hypothetical protein